MNAALLLLVSLSTQGYWLSGEAGHVRIALTEAAGAAGGEAVVAWDISAGNAKLAEGQLRVLRGQAGDLSIDLPEVRARTELQLRYAARAIDGSPLESGQRMILLYPRDLLQPAHQTLGQRITVVADAEDELPRALRDAEIRHRVLPRVPVVRFRRDEIILIAPGRASTGFAQSAALEAARGGAGVIVLQQLPAKTALGHPMAARVERSMLLLDEKHPILADLPREDVEAWLAPAAAVHAIRLPVEHDLELIAHWAADGEQVDAMIAVMRMGDGMLIVCQAPVESWRRDPRAQILLGNMLRYLHDELAKRRPPAPFALGGPR